MLRVRVLTAIGLAKRERPDCANVVHPLVVLEAPVIELFLRGQPVFRRRRDHIRRVEPVADKGVKKRDVRGRAEDSRMKPSR